MSTEQYILDVIEGKRSAPLLQFFLALLSRPYQLAVRGRNFVYQQGWLPSFKASSPVVSIGNLVVGGTGKTPLVQMLAQALQEKGMVAILTRGFRSQAEKRKEPLRIDKDHLVSAELCGDEPFILAETTGAAVWVSTNRVRSAQLAEASGADCLILDDGLQHRKLKRDIEIIVVDAKDPFSRHRFLPYGLLRDLPARLREADLVIATHTKDLQHYEEVKKELSAYTQAPIVAMQHELEHQQALCGQRVGAFCGIGKPDYFFDALKKAGAEIVATRRLLDHQMFPLEELNAFAIGCKKKGANRVVCTQKDWVKVKEVSCELPIEPIGMWLNILAGKEHWDLTIEKIKQKMKGFR